MNRISIVLPEKWPFSVQMQTRITDLNFGNHVGNNSFAALLHEARAQYLASMDFTELNAGGTALIMSDLGIEYRKELLYPDLLQIWVGPGAYGTAGFDLVYKMEVYRNDAWILAALAKTGMLCYNYEQKKVIRIPALLKEALSGA